MEFVAPPAPRPTVTHPSCIYSMITGYRPLELDLHVPAGDGPHPLAIWVHGGGWREGGRAILPETIAPHGFHERFLARGFAVADVDYRLSSEATYPAQIEDVQAAIRWLRHFADRFGLDTDRVAAIGESAGAHLASMAGLLGEGDTAVHAVVSWYGPADFERLRDPSSATDSPARLLGGPVAGRREFARWASPAHRVHPGAPPFLLVHGTADATLPYEHSEWLAAALRAHGVRCDLLTVPGADHCFAGHDDVGGLIDASIDFVADALKP